jgi:hypothetical protein
MRSSLLSARLLVVTVALGLSLTACGDKDAPAAAGGSDAEVAGSAKAAITQANFDDRMFGAMAESGSAKVHFTAGAGAQAMRGDGEMKFGKKMAMRMTMRPASGAASTRQEVIMVGDTFYVTAGDKYMSMSMDDMKGQGMPNMSSTLDPAVQAKAFGVAVTSFKQAGPAVTLDGVKAIPYAITIDPTKAPDVFGKAINRPLTFIYYVGPDDLPRKMDYKDANGEFTATYNDWGAPVTIEEPPADKVMKGMG